MGCCGGRRRKEEGWPVHIEVVELETEERTRCVPMPAHWVVLVLVLASLLPLLLVMLAAYFITLRPLVVLQTSDGMVSTANAAVDGQTSQTSNTPSTATTTVRTATSSSTSSATSQDYASPPLPAARCKGGRDVEPALCDIAAGLGLCDTPFSRANCRLSCGTDPACRDLVQGCFKIRLFGLCNQAQFAQACCASCAV